MTKRLYIYYDNPTDASNMYLKYLKLDAEKHNVQIIMMNDLERLSSTFEDGYNENEDFVLPLYPLSSRDMEKKIIGTLGAIIPILLTYYGYTTFNFNSKSDKDDMLSVLEYADIVVGLSSKDYVLNSEECDRLGYWVKEFIDGGNNFCTKNKSRCGKWTRDILFSRMN